MKINRRIIVEAKPSEVREIQSKIDAAIRLLHNGKSWIQDEESDGDGNFCMLGALKKVGLKSEHRKIVAAAINPDQFNDAGADGIITEFNDAFGRTFPDIGKKFRQAKKLLKGK